MVSIHAPTRGATKTSIILPLPKWFQSTHPHGVRHTFLFCTQNPKGFNPRTHTGCDRLVKIIISGNTCFNPRTHTGCDNKQKYAIAKFAVSIHAPTRGATFSRLARHRKGQSFNPRTHTGCDERPIMKLPTGLVSIHAPTRGATAAGYSRAQTATVSIHAPTRGATYC